MKKRIKLWLFNRKMRRIIRRRMEEVEPQICIGGARTISRDILIHEGARVLCDIAKKDGWMAVDEYCR